MEVVATCELLSVEEGRLSGIGWQTLMGVAHSTLCELEVNGLRCADVYILWISMKLVSAGHTFLQPPGTSR